MEDEVKRLREKCENLKREIAKKDAVLHQKNLALDALGYVWCSGGCKGGHFRYHEDWELTEEQVSMVERNTLRLRRGFENHKCGKAQEEGKPGERCEICSGKSICFKEKSDG